MKKEKLVKLQKTDITKGNNIHDNVSKIGHMAKND
jgi:hypothetical protein